MEYRLGKTLNSNGIFLSNHSYVNLLSNPLNDYVNPGVGMTTRLYSLYVPIRSMKPKFIIEKEIEIEPKESKNDQLGFGSINESEPIANNELSSSINEPSSSNIDSLSSNSFLKQNDEKEINISKDDFKNTENSLKRSRMDDGILETFMHPKIKVGKIEVDKIDKKKVILPKHKFKII